MPWTRLPFGKHAGKTLPQVIIADLDWFYWVLPKLYGQIAIEAHKLAKRAGAIKIPRRKRRRFAVEYYYEDERFNGFSFVAAGSMMHVRGARRLPHLDLSMARGGRSYDKLAGRKMTRHFRINFFGRGKRLTKKRCEKFFDDAGNFANP